MESFAAIESSKSKGAETLEVQVLFSDSGGAYTSAVPRKYCNPELAGTRRLRSASTPNAWIANNMRWNAMIVQVGPYWDRKTGEIDRLLRNHKFSALALRKDIRNHRGEDLNFQLVWVQLSLVNEKALWRIPAYYANLERYLHIHHTKNPNLADWYTGTNVPGKVLYFRAFATARALGLSEGLAKKLPRDEDRYPGKLLFSQELVAVLNRLESIPPA